MAIQLFTLQFAGWRNDLNKCFLLDNFRSKSSNNYWASHFDGVCTENLDKKAKKFCTHRFVLKSKSSKHSVENFPLVSSTFACIDSLSFSDKLDSTRMENFLHKSPHIYDLFSVSVLNIYHRRYWGGSIQINSSRRIVFELEPGGNFSSLFSVFVHALNVIGKSFWVVVCFNFQY